MKDDIRVIGEAYFHTGNSGLYVRLLDRGFGISMEWHVGAMGLTTCHFEIDLTKNALDNLMWLCIEAAVNDKHYNDQDSWPSPVRISSRSLGEVLLISPTGKVEIGYTLDPRLTFYIKGKCHGAPNFGASIETDRESFAKLALLFHKAKKAQYSPNTRHVYEVKEPTSLCRDYGLKGDGGPSRQEEAFAKFKVYWASLPKEKPVSLKEMLQEVLPNGV